MSRSNMLLTVVATCVLAAASAHAQSLADRVSAVGTGTATVQVAARPGVCGDGKDVILYGQTVIVWPSIFGYGSTNTRCEAGPLRVALTVSGGRVTRVRTTVGGSAGLPRATDLGAVPATRAVEYFLDLARRSDGRVAEDALTPAALADSITVWPELLRLARERGAAMRARERALTWLGTVAPDSVAPRIEEIARSEREEEQLREAALSALAQMHNGAGVPALIRLARGEPSAWATKKAVFWLGQADDDRARAELRRIVESRDTPEELKGEAIFALGQDNSGGRNSSVLRSVYGRLSSHRLREKVFQALSESGSDEDNRWLTSVVLDATAATEDRKQAAFWAGQGEVPFADMTKLYEQVREPELKKHLIFVYSQSDEDAATDKLIQIAKTDRDASMRKEAIFWLGQRDDPRVAELLEQILKQ